MKGLKSPNFALVIKTIFISFVCTCIHLLCKYNMGVSDLQTPW